MPLTEAKKKVVTKLVKMYVTPSGRINPWFSRKLNQEPPEVRDEVWKEIRDKQLDEKRDVLHTRFRVDKDEIVEPDESGRGKNIMWTDEEWDKLADFVHRARRKNPVPSIGTHIKSAMPQFPEDRRRNLTTNNIDPLLDRLREKDRESQAALELVPRLKDRLAQLDQVPTKEDILQNLSDEEVCRHFQQRILDLVSPNDVISSFDLEDVLASVPTSTLVGYTATRVMEHLESNASGLQEAFMSLSAATGGKKATPTVVSSPPGQKKVQIKKPRIAILGMKPNQTQIVEQQINGRADVVFIPKDMKSNSVRTMVADIFLLWGSFCSHQDQVHVKARAKQLGAKFVVYHGGMAKLIETIDAEAKLAAA